MNLTSMKTDESSVCCAPDNPYGYGLRINLSDDQCEALGIKTPLPAGSRVQLGALAIVTEVTQSVESGGEDQGPDIRMCLQITDLGMEPAKPTVDAKAMYPNSGYTE